MKTNRRGINKQFWLNVVLILSLSFFLQNSAAQTINNDTWWTDTDGNPIYCNGGKITRVGARYYWVGHTMTPSASETNWDIRMYSSPDLGSNTWKYEGIILDAKGKYVARPTLLGKNPKTGKYVLVYKTGTLNFATSNTLTGRYTHVRSVQPSEVSSKDQSAYVEGDDAYYVYSCKKDGKRYTGINKLDENWTNIIEPKLIFMRAGNREAPDLFKRNGKYYITYSECKGWRPSNTFYWMADSISGTWTEIGQIGGGGKRSFETQHDFIIQLHNGQWLFGGDRFPMFDQYTFPSGRNILAPITWDGDKPVLVCEESWKPMDYTSAVPSVRNDNFSMYLNLVNNILNINLSHNPDKNAFFNIISLSGKIILQGKILLSHEQINMSNLQNGLYIVVINNGNELYNGKLIKK